MKTRRGRLRNAVFRPCVLYERLRINRLAGTAVLCNGVRDYRISTRLLRKYADDVWEEKKKTNRYNDNKSEKKRKKKK